MFKAMENCVVRRSLTPAALQKLRNVFGEMDTDASGSVSLAEFQEASTRLSLAIASDELDAFLQADFVGAQGTLLGT